MPFSLQFFGRILLQKTCHSPKKKPCYQKSASHYRDTLRLVSQPFDKVKARQYLKIFHKKLISFFQPGSFHRAKPGISHNLCQPGERSGNLERPTAYEFLPHFALPRDFVNLLFLRRGLRFLVRALKVAVDARRRSERGAFARKVPPPHVGSYGLPPRVRPGKH